VVEVLTQLRERYDLVVINTAPTDVVTDAFPLVRCCCRFRLRSRIEQSVPARARRTGGRGV